MHIPTLLPRFAVIALLLGAALVEPAVALTFSASCNRFEVDGNAFGPADGTPDFVDNFTGGSLSPSWSQLLGTAAEAGGALVIQNPGASLQLGPTLFEISTVENEVHEIDNGAGNFTATSSWASVLPATDTEFHMELYSTSPIVEAAGITLNNFSPQIAAQQGPPAIAGPSISQSLTHGFGPSFTTVEIQTVAVDPASFTGHILLRMQFDDTTDMLTSSFSLDDGVTFQSPFPAMHLFNGGVTAYDILLGAAGLTPNGPPPPPPGPPPPSIPPPCTSGSDAITGAPWVVCAADSSTAWLSSESCCSPYHALTICQSLGYSSVSASGGNFGSVCGYDQNGTSCSSPGARVFTGGSYCGGSGLSGELCNTVNWQCSTSLCGNGVVNPGEQCDDGLYNGAGGGCCTSDCHLMTSGSACVTYCASTAQCDGSGHCIGVTPVSCDDGDNCTVDTCNPLSGDCTSTKGPKAFGVDESGCLPPDRTTAKCESRVAKAASRLAGALIGCDLARVAGKLPTNLAEFDCESKAQAKFGATHITRCAACTYLGAPAAVVQQLIATCGRSVYCTPGAPLWNFEGYMPPDAPGGPIAKCDERVAKGVAKLVGGIVKCHVGRAGGKRTTNAAEEACEEKAQTKFGETDMAGCAGCTDLGPIGDFVRAQLDGSNDLLYCASPSGAFIDALGLLHPN
jgi:hypothetical protein